MRLIRKLIKKLIRILGWIFYRKSWESCQIIPPEHLLAIGFAQRIVGFNRRVPWPVHPSSTVHAWEKIDFGSPSPLPGYSPGNYIQANCGIKFGDGVIIAAGVKIISQNHDLNDYDLHLESNAIEIGDHCWIAANAVILPGVKLGKHIVVAAGAVVNRSFEEDNIVIGGVPAEVLKRLEPYRGGMEKKAEAGEGKD